MARRRSPHGRAVDVWGSSGTARRGRARRWKLWDFDLGGIFGGRKRARTGRSTPLPKLIVRLLSFGSMKARRVERHRIPMTAVYRGERARQMRGTRVWPKRRGRS